MSLSQESQFLTGIRFHSPSFSPYPLAFSLSFASLQELGSCDVILKALNPEYLWFQFLTGIRVI